MINRINEDRYYWFYKSWDKKRKRNSFVSNDDFGKIIIADKIPNLSGEYKIAKIKKLGENYSIVSLGERKKPEDLFSEINFEEAVDVLKKFEFEIFIRDYDYERLASDENDKVTHEHQVIAWHHKLGIFVNGGTWDSGASFNNLYITCPNIFGSTFGYFAGLISMSSNEICINVVDSHYKHNILSSIINKLKYMKIENGIHVSHNINGVKTYYDLNNYDMRGNTFEVTEARCQKIYDMLPASGKRFMDEHAFVKND